MKTEINIPVRAYQVELKDTRTGKLLTDTIVLEKSRIQAAALFNMGDKDIICRTYNHKGFRVLEIGKPEKLELTIDLEEACCAMMLQIAQENDGVIDG